jgi:NADPH:quinone reductase-like Zn-dependent oxidoreductase
MKAVVLTGTGGYDVLRVQERPDPPVDAGEVRIAVKAAGVNFADTMARVGLYPDAPKPPCVLGYEVAGVVEAVGEEVRDHAVGDRVVAGTRFGGQAELVSVSADQAWPLPERLSFEQGAAFPVNYGTAYAALVVMGSLREGTRVLIHAAGGGVGVSATQIARNAGAEIFGTASASKHDALGPTSFRKDYRLLRPGGRLVMYGVSENSKGGRRDVAATLKGLLAMPTATMPWWKSLMLMNENKGVFGLNMLKWLDSEGGLDRLVEPLVADLAAGRLEPLVAEAFPFERAGEAHRFIAERRNVGKVVLFPS